MDNFKKTLRFQTILGTVETVYAKESVESWDFSNHENPQYGYQATFITGIFRGVSAFATLRELAIKKLLVEAISGYAQSEFTSLDIADAESVEVQS
jgi:hypothetical protein